MILLPLQDFQLYLTPHEVYVLTMTVNVLLDWNLMRCVNITGSGFNVVLQEMENTWNNYSRLERDVDWLKTALQGQMDRRDLSQVCSLAIFVST